MKMSQTKKIKDMIEEERPYEKCERLGVSSLTDIELLAVLLRNGAINSNSLELARRILYPLNQRGGLINLHQYSLAQLKKIHGIGRVKALQIVCIVELGKRLSKASAIKGLDFSSAAKIAEYYMEDLRHHQQEYMKLLMLNTKARLIGETDISKGTVNASLVSPRELFIEALQKNAVSIILLHNHPSGDPTPSKEDILITKRIKEAGNLIGIELLDHIIIGNNCYTSLAEQNLV